MVLPPSGVQSQAHRHGLLFDANDRGYAARSVARPTQPLQRERLCRQCAGICRETIIRLVEPVAWFRPFSPDDDLQTCGKGKCRRLTPIKKAIPPKHYRCRFGGIALFCVKGTTTRISPLRLCRSIRPSRYLRSRSLPPTRYKVDLCAESGEQHFSVSYHRNNFSDPKRYPGDSVILVALLIRLVENMRNLFLHP
jgi:hypothetical protein